MADLVGLMSFITQITSILNMYFSSKLFYNKVIDANINSLYVDSVSISKSIIDVLGQNVVQEKNKNLQNICPKNNFKNIEGNQKSYKSVKESISSDRKNNNSLDKYEKQKHSHISNRRIIPRKGNENESNISRTASRIIELNKSPNFRKVDNGGNVKEAQQKKIVLKLNLN